MSLSLKRQRGGPSSKTASMGRFPTCEKRSGTATYFKKQLQDCNLEIRKDIHNPPNSRLPQLNLPNLSAIRAAQWARIAQKSAWPHLDSRRRIANTARPYGRAKNQ